MTPVLSSERLYFSPTGEKHFEDFCAMDMDAEVMKHSNNRPHGTREQAR